MRDEDKAYYSENCRICHAPFTIENYMVAEMMFGFRDKFSYQQCSSCGCLQITELPSNIEKYYPPHYYSFTQQIPKLRRLPFFKRLFAEMRLKKKYGQNLDILKHLKPVNAKINYRILDVGCGRGRLICELFNQGFKNVSGIDKFIPQEIKYDFGVKILKKELTDLQSNSYDVITMHHVLEHIDQQHKTIKDCYDLLKKNGCLVLGVPLLATAWEEYKHNWVQLDAPRHYFLHTVKSITILAETNGFEIKHSMFDSTSFQFWGSEFYKRDIPLFTEENNYGFYPVEKLFNNTQIEGFENRAKELNRLGKGDSGVFYLYKK